MLTALKNKIIEIEGVVREYKAFEKHFTVESSKFAKQLDAKDKEIRELKAQNSQLE